MRGKTLAASFQVTPELGSSQHTREWDCHSAAPHQAREVGWHKAYNIQPKQTWSSANGSPWCRKQLWGRQPGGWTGVGSNSDGHQPRAGLHLQKHRQQDKKSNYYSLFSSVRLHLEQSVQFWFPCYKTDTDKVAKIQQIRPRWCRGCST